MSGIADKARNKKTRSSHHGNEILGETDQMKRGREKCLSLELGTLCLWFPFSKSKAAAEISLFFRKGKEIKMKI